MGDLKSSDKVKYGIYGSSEGYRMIDGHLFDNFTALCGFGRSQSFVNLHKCSDLMFCYVSLSVCLSVVLSVCLSFCLPVCLSLSLSLSLSKSYGWL